MPRGRAASVLVAAAMVVVALAACGGEDQAFPDPEIPSSPTETEAPEPEASEEPEESPGSVPVKEIIQDIEVSQKVVNRFWANNWGEFFTGSYTPPKLVNAGYKFGLYDGEEGVAECGGETLGPDNAFYCPREDVVAFDIGLMLKAQTEGDSLIFYVVTNEYGHAVQQRLSKDLNSVAAELQADCLAAAALYGAADRGC